jgi:hypothetical protein
VGIGVQRSGTSWWYELLAAHPGVQPGPRKELHYFHRYWNKPFAATDAAGYEALFPRPPGTITGEWSPGYLSHFWVPPLLARAAPEARLLVIVRSPVERYRSGMLLFSQTRRMNAADASAAFRLGCYADQFETLFASVPRERVLVLQYEQCAEDTRTQLARTYRFLGLDDGFEPDSLRDVRNVLPGSKPSLGTEQLRALVKAYEPQVRALRALDVGIDTARWPEFADLT